LRPARESLRDLPTKGWLRRWMVFNAVGAAGIVVQLAALVLLTRLWGWNYLAATAAAVELAVLHNFVWHERWTWADRAVGGVGSRLNRLLKFHLSNGLFSILGNLLLMRLFAGTLGMNLVVANLISIATCSILNFLAGEHLVFTRAA